MQQKEMSKFSDLTIFSDMCNCGSINLKESSNYIIASFSCYILQYVVPTSPPMAFHQHQNRQTLNVHFALNSVFWPVCLAHVRYSFQTQLHENKVTMDMDSNQATT